MSTERLIKWSTAAADRARVAAARAGDLEQALTLGLRSLEGERRSIPGLLARSRDLAEIVKAKYGSEPLALDYLERLRGLG